jgi:hypothetical protein
LVNKKIYILFSRTFILCFELFSLKLIKGIFSSLFSLLMGYILMNIGVMIGIVSMIMTVFTQCVFILGLLINRFFIIFHLEIVDSKSIK